MNFWRIKIYYEKHLWTKEMVRKAVEKGVITAAEYAVITNEEYNDGNEKS